MSDDKSRIQWFDSIKGFAILAVVLGHVLNGYMGNNAFPDAAPYLVLSKTWIYLWHMPLFIFLSGFAFSLSILDTADDSSVQVKKDRVKRSIVNWLIIYTVFELGLSASNIIFSSFVNSGTTVGELFETLLFPKNIMWYLWTVIIFYIIFAWLTLHKISKLFLLTILIVISIAAAVFNDIYGLRRCFQGLFGYAVYFYLGILFCEYMKIGDIRGEQRRTAIMLLSLFYIACFSALFINGSLPSYVLIRDILEFLMALAAIAAVQIVFMQVSSIGGSRMLSSLGKASLVIYLLHSYIVSVIKYVITKNGHFNPLFAVLLTFLVSSVISYGIYLLSKKNKWIGYLFKPISFIDRLRGEKR